MTDALSLFRRPVLAAAVVFAVSGLAACGGGGGGSADGGASTGAVGMSPPASSSGSGGNAAGGGPGSLALDANTSCNLPDFRNQMLQQINAARAMARSCGGAPAPAVAPLAWNDRLFSAAARHSTDMATNNYFSHTGLDGRSPSQRMAAEGYAASWTGEVIAAGQSSVSAAMNSWLASPDHCANIMRAEFRDVGASCVQRAGSEFRYYWTMTLARPR